jgi:hypothetical protein
MAWSGVAVSGDPGWVCQFVCLRVCLLISGPPARYRFFTWGVRQDHEVVSAVGRHQRDDAWCVLRLLLCVVFAFFCFRVCVAASRIS